MALDFTRLKKVTNSNRLLFALLIGRSGSGKSTLAGTLGVPTLFICGQNELHGAMSAATKNSEIYRVVYNVREETDTGPEFKDFAVGTRLSPDLSLQKLRSVLSSDLGPTIKAVVFDGYTELDHIIRASSEFDIKCRTDKGQRNSFKETDVSKEMLRGITSLLQEQVSKGRHAIATLGATHTLSLEPNSPETVKPELLGFNVARTLPYCFSDICFLDTITQKGVLRHVLAFNTQASLTQKDVAGNVKAQDGFTACIRGIPREKLPAFMKADLKQVLALIENGGVKDDGKEPVV